MPEQVFPIGERSELPGHFPEPVVLEAVRALGEGSECCVRLADGSLEEVVLSHEETVALAGHAVAAGGTALFIDLLATAPYRLFFFEITVKGKDTRNNDVLLHAEVVAVREDSGQFELVPADVLYMRLMSELGIKPEYKLATDEAKRHLDDLERSKKERLLGLDRLQIARTGPVRQLATAVVVPPDAEIENEPKSKVTLSATRSNSNTANGPRRSSSAKRTGCTWYGTR